MLRIENVETCNWKAAIRGMRNPLESWDKSDTVFKPVNSDIPCEIGPNDLDLMKRLANAGTDHSKYLRMVTVSFDITAPLCWWKEFDTYKIGTVRNSCSTMHKIESKHLGIDNFSTEVFESDDIALIMVTIDHINKLIDKYKNSTGEEKRIIHQRIVKLLPDGYLQRATITTNYQVLRNIRNSERQNHKLDEWKTDFINFIDELPYSKELLLNANPKRSDM